MKSSCSGSDFDEIVFLGSDFDEFEFIFQAQILMNSSYYFRLTFRWIPFIISGSHFDEHEQKLQERLQYERYLHEKHEQDRAKLEKERTERDRSKRREGSAAAADQKRPSSRQQRLHQHTMVGFDEIFVWNMHSYTGCLSAKV